jgi:uncharacterized YigZ family protein
LHQGQAFRSEMTKKESKPIFSYTTIKAESQGAYKEKGSKFLSFAYPIATEEEAKARVEGLRKEYFDASHHCFAWVLGPDRSRYRAFDDGEPNHSAGDPILGQIRSKNLTNVVVVVVRYFGGTKLGVGGLIAAYRAAAEDVLNQAAFEEREVKEKGTIMYPYEATPEVMRLIKDFDLKIEDQKFEEICSMKIEIKLSVKNAFVTKAELLKAKGNKINFEWSLL